MNDPRSLVHKPTQTYQPVATCPQAGRLPRSRIALMTTPYTIGAHFAQRVAKIAGKLIKASFFCIYLLTYYGKAPPKIKITPSPPASAHKS
jgi:hypothetical protein